MEEVRVLRTVTRAIDLCTYGVSFHLPLHRLLAQMLMAAVPFMTAPIEAALPVQYRGAGFLAALLEDLLSLAVCVAQVRRASTLTLSPLSPPSPSPNLSHIPNPNPDPNLNLRASSRVVLHQSS